MLTLAEIRAKRTGIPPTPAGGGDVLAELDKAASQYNAQQAIAKDTAAKEQQIRSERSGVGEILPVTGSVVGGIIGSGVGGYPGGIAGSGIGAAAGEAVQQGIEKIAGQRNEFDTSEMAGAGLKAGATEAIAVPVFNLLGKFIKGAGKKVVELATPTSAKEARIIQAYKANHSFFERLGSRLGLNDLEAPVTAGSTTFEKGLMGSESGIGVQAKKEARNIWKNVLAPKLQESEVAVNMPDFFKAAEEKIIKETPELARQEDLINALNSLRESYKGIDDVGLPALQKFKEGWAKYVPEKAYMGKPIAGAFNDVKDTLSDMVRQTMYNVLGPEAKKAYFDYGNLQTLQEIGQKAMTGRIKGGTGTTIAALKNMLLTPIATIGGQTVYKIGEGLEFVGRPGARVLRNLFGLTSEVGKPLNPDAVTKLESQSVSPEDTR